MLRNAKPLHTAACSDYLSRSHGWQFAGPLTNSPVLPILTASLRGLDRYPLAPAFLSRTDRRCSRCYQQHDASPSRSSAPAIHGHTGYQHTALVMGPDLDHSSGQRPQRMRNTAARSASPGPHNHQPDSPMPTYPSSFVALTCSMPHAGDRPESLQLPRF